MTKHKQQKNRKVHYQLYIENEPTTEPVILEDMKDWLRMKGITAEDAIISSLIKTARKYAEKYTRKSFISTDWILKQDSIHTPICLDRSPIISLTSFEYYDSSEVLQTLDLNDDIYQVLNQSPPQIVLKEIPSVYDRPDAVIIKFKAGFGTSSNDVPELIQDAIKLMVADLYINRQDRVHKLPTKAQHLLKTFRAWRF